MDILTVKLFYEWYNKAVTELLNAQDHGMAVVICICP